jgi:heme A synthase
MRASAVPLAIYALLIGITSAVLWAWTSDTLPPALLSGGALAFAVIAAIVAIRGRRLDERGELPEAKDRPVPDLSFATVAIGLGIINVVVGLYLGLYLILIGAAILGFGVAGLIRETLAERRAFRRIEGGTDAS